jgi:hypothetical protein
MKSAPGEMWLAAVLGICAGTVLQSTALGAPDAAAKEDLAKATQNPVADLISLPFQYNLNFGVGPEDQKQSVLNIQPVYPLELSSDWNLITRTILPVISQPSFGTPDGTTNGIGDVQFSAFMSPAHSGDWIWGAGAIVQAPSASNPVLGQGKWGIGPTVVVLHLTKGSPWVYGALVNNVTSVGGNVNRATVNQALVQPFINYNVPSRPGMSVGFSPIITANWRAQSDQWTVPLGLGLSQVLFIGNQAVSVQLAGYSNVVRQQYTGSWTARLQLTLLFPRSKR